ncbi:hypothetical protein SDC9_197450 [bioreactor metagenome]|uniref:Uncharacterized protein n=1 Tax=bioreactor metagenome TaxID=1076179 RepID=A0A645IEV2_9ZZZZ
MARMEVGRAKAQLHAADAIYTYGNGSIPIVVAVLMTMGINTATAAVLLDEFAKNRPNAMNINNRR